MNKTAIEWCDMTWNPVTGCKHGCKYCYARKTALRWGARDFLPAFHEKRLIQPAKRKKPTKVFVVSMGDLFGKFIPDEWIEKVFKACEAAPQHTYMFLTKNPDRYAQFESWFYPNDEARKRAWSGASITNQTDLSKVFWEFALNENNFLSIEPFLGQVNEKMAGWYDWLIVGSETRNGNPVNMPKREWILDIRQQCQGLKIPLFEKNSLAGLDLPGGLIQEWPAEMSDA